MAGWLTDAEVVPRPAVEAAEGGAEEDEQEMGLQGMGGLGDDY